MAQGSLLRMGDLVVGEGWACLLPCIHPLGSAWALGHRKLPLEGGEDGEAGWISLHLCCSTPAAMRGVRPEAPGKSLKLRWLHFGWGEWFQEGLGCPGLESPLTGRPLLPSLFETGFGCPAGSPLLPLLSEHPFISLTSPYSESPRNMPGLCRANVGSPTFCMCKTDSERSWCLFCVTQGEILPQLGFSKGILGLGRWVGQALAE